VAGEKITVTGPDGKPFETILPDGFMPTAVVEKDYIPRKSHDDAFAKFRQNSATELLTDAEFRAQALRTWGVASAGNGGAGGAGAGGDKGGGAGAGGGTGGAGAGAGEPDPTTIQRYRDQFRREWEEQDLKPLQEERTTLTTEVAGARQLLMERAVVDAALDVGVDPELCKGMNGDMPEIVKLLVGQVAYDPESKRVFACDPSKPEDDPNPWRISGKRRGEGEPPWMTPRELLEDWIKTHPRYAVQSKQRGAGFQQAAGGGGAGRSKVIQGGNTPEAAREFGRNLEDIAAGTVKVAMPGVSE